MDHRAVSERQCQLCLVWETSGQPEKGRACGPQNPPEPHGSSGKFRIPQVARGSGELAVVVPVVQCEQAEPVIVWQHPTLPYGFDGDENLYLKRMNGKWVRKAIKKKGNRTFIVCGNRQIGLQAMRRDCGLPSWFDSPANQVRFGEEWDEHEELRQLKRSYCETCGQRHQHRSRSPRLCMHCYTAWKMAKQVWTCQRCGQSFSGRKKRFCGESCRRAVYDQKQKDTKVQRNCNVCGVEFLTNKRKRALCCSEECLGQWKEARRPEWVMAEGTCLRCKEEFRRRVIPRHRHTVGRYCSTQCSKRDREAANMRASRKRGRTDLRPLLSTIADRDAWVCQLCRRKVDPRLSNLQLAHYGCNSRKCNRHAEIGRAVN